MAAFSVTTAEMTKKDFLFKSKESVIKAAGFKDEEIGMS